MNSNLEQVLFLSKRKKVITNSPFYCCYVDDYLPDDIYQSCLNTFPSSEYFLSGKRRNEKRYIGSRHRIDAYRKFCQREPQWNRLIQFFKSQAFISDLFPLVQRGLFFNRGWRGLKSWKICPPEGDLSYARLKNEAKRPLSKISLVDVGIEFSSLLKGDMIYPHTDAAAKLISLMIYFPSPDWKAQYEGETTFYRVKNILKAPKWRNWQGDHCTGSKRYETFLRDMTPCFKNEFKKNRLVLFMKTHSSYHSVLPIQCPDNLSRNSFNINIKLIH